MLNKCVIEDCYRQTPNSKLWWSTHAAERVLLHLGEVYYYHPRLIVNMTLLLALFVTLLSKTDYILLLWLLYVLLKVNALSC